MTRDTRPLAVDLFAGLGGWTEGLLAEGYRVVGFDNERHVYGQARYPAQLVLQDVRTIHGAQFKDAALIVASPPCQAYSYRAMPWKRAKALPPPDNTLFEACFRIQREAIEAAGHHIPLVVENVCGAQKWVGRARWHFGSFFLWGDVPALMPITRHRGKGPKPGTGNQFCAIRIDQIQDDGDGVKVATIGAGWYPPGHPKHVPGLAFNGHADRNLREGVKYGDRNVARANGGHQWTTGFDVPAHRQISEGWRSKHYENTEKMRIAGSAVEETGVKQGGDWFNDSEPSISRLTGSKSKARKAASAHIAKIPLPLARWIARSWHPQLSEATA